MQLREFCGGHPAALDRPNRRGMGLVDLVGMGSVEDLSTDDFDSPRSGRRVNSVRSKEEAKDRKSPKPVGASAQIQG